MARSVSDIITQLISKLKSGTLAERERAALDLGIHCHESCEVKSALAIAIRYDVSPDVKMAGLLALSNVGSAAGPILIETLQVAKDAALRRKAAELLGRFGENIPGAITVLLGAVQGDRADAIAEVRRAAIWALGQLGEAGVPGVVRALEEDPDSSVRAGAARALGLTDKIGAVAVAALLGRLRDQHEEAWVREVSVQALSSHKNPEIMAALLTTAEDRTIPRSLRQLILETLYSKPKRGRKSYRSNFYLDNSNDSEDDNQPGKSGSRQRRKKRETLPLKEDADVNNESRKREVCLEGLFATSPGDPWTHLRSLYMTHQEYLQRLAAVLSPCIQEILASESDTSFERKQALSKEVNAILNWFGLAIRSPDAQGRASILLAAPGRNKTGGGMWQFECRDGGTRRRFSWTELDKMTSHLDLIPDDRRRVKELEERGAGRG